MRPLFSPLMHRVLKRLSVSLLLALALNPLAAGARKEPGMLNVGPKKCKSCHEEAFRVWRGTEHFKGYARLHRSKRAKKILSIVGGKSSPKKNWSCTLCHYSWVKKKRRRPRTRAGVSCESCHGPAAPWLDVHWDYEQYKKPENEPPEHKRKRLAAAREAGMRHTGMPYDLAKACMRCHGLARDDLPAKKLARMLAAGHPLKPAFELVQYSQGSVRHRFRPPDLTVNQELPPAELARMLVVGAAAKLVSASTALGRIDEARYVEAQTERAAEAVKVLRALDDIPEAAALVAQPSDENARKLVAAIEGKDLCGKVAQFIAPKSDFK